MARWDFDSVIVGGGPGGLVAALYLRRFRRSVLVVNEGISRAEWIPKTHNLIGYYKGISGKNLLARMHQQLDEVKTERMQGRASVKKISDGFQIAVGKHKITASSVIIGTGIQDTQPELENLMKLRKKGLLRYCPVCDAYNYRNEPLSVFINDEGGLERALFVSHYSSKVTVIAPSGFTPSPIRIKQMKKLNMNLVNGVVEKVEETFTGNGIWVHVADRKPLFSKVTYVEMGCTVNNDVIKGMKNVRKTQSGFFITSVEQRIGPEGLFAVGDCVNNLGQISVAAGQAAVAATAIHDDLLKW